MDDNLIVPIVKGNKKVVDSYREIIDFYYIYNNREV